MKILRMKSKHYQGILKITNNLKEWFDELGRKFIAIDIKHQEGFVAIENNNVTGFVSLFVYNGALNIGWIAVKRGNHRKGIGEKLINATINYAKKLKINTIKVYTLGDSVKYKPYEATRNFYYKQGFKVFERCQTDNPGCPEEMKMKYEIINANNKRRAS